MRHFVLFLSLALVGCGKPSPNRTILSACELITKEEVTAVVGSTIKETQSSEKSEGGLRISHCLYSADEFSKSVSLSLRQTDPSSADKTSPKDFWKHTFGVYETDGKSREREGDREKRESLLEQRSDEQESIPPMKIKEVGDQAYWVGDRVGGALFVMKRDVIVRVSVGGADNQETKVEKSKMLIRKALQRL
jgi:hypothetical protein